MLDIYEEWEEIRESRTEILIFSLYYYYYYSFYYYNDYLKSQ